MALRLRGALGAAAVLFASQAMAQITFYEGEHFRGRALSVDRSVPNMDRRGIGDRAGSVVVERGRWEVCELPRFEGRCAVLRRGHYDSLRGSGLEWSISSVRPADSRRRYDFEPAVSAAPAYNYRRRPGERTYEVPVNWSRAVMGPPSQRCWVERQAVPTASSSGNVGGALAGAVIGGILGHQVGGGSGRDAATAVGVIAGAAIGSQAGGGSPVYATQDVQRCQQTVSGPPAYWDVNYTFRGVQHNVQMSAPPGSSIVVNERGEPRG
jgi:uncharacterized protein YcfJ